MPTTTATPPLQPPPVRRMGASALGYAVVLAMAAAGCALPLATSAQTRAGLDTGTRQSAHPGKTKIYKYLKGGTASFSDTPPTQGPYTVLTPTCYACSLASTINWHATRLQRDAFAPEIGASAQQFGLDPALVRAVIHAESGFNPSARSRAGAVGLMQLMPGTARMMGVTDSTTPRHNIQGGARYLASLLARFKNDISLATAAYNAGPEAVKKYAGIPPYAETQTYVQRVRILHQRYRSDPHS